MKNKFLVSIVGPTAIGKTTLGIELANAFKTEIVSADSRQFFKEMQIGTATPSEEELAAAPHHFIHHKSVRENYSVGDFERDALARLNELFQRYNVLVLVGGSGLYVKSVLEGLNDFPEIPAEVRNDLNKIAEKQGLEPLRKKLKALDPQSYNELDIQNPHRVIRALEVRIGTGIPFSSFLNKPKASRNFIPIKIGLDAPRGKIYERINERVDKMIEEGLIEEARSLYPLQHLNALNTVGYKEIFKWLDGEFTGEEAIEEIKKNSRRFAKRQLTWFRKEKDITWFKNTDPVQEIIKFIELEIQKKNFPT